MFVIWELRHPNPMVNLRLLGDRNFLSCGLIIYIAVSLGIAMVTVLVDRRSQFHQLRLAEHVTPLNPAVDQWVQYFAETRMVRGGVTRAVAEQQGMGLLSQMVHSQAREMAYLDPFMVFSIMALAALPLILLMKKSVARGEVAVH